MEGQRDHQPFQSGQLVYLPSFLWRFEPIRVMASPYGTSRSEALDTPHSVGLLWTSDQPDAKTSTGLHTTLTRDKHPRRKRDSNPQCHRVSGRRPTPKTARPLGSAAGVPTRIQL